MAKAKKKVVKMKPGTKERRADRKKHLDMLTREGKKNRAAKAKNPNHNAALASRGNQWWNLRSEHGRDKLFENPELLWKAACEYFQSEIDNPLFTKKEWKTVNGKLKLVEIPLANVYTMQGLCHYLSCDTSYFRSFEIQLKKTDPLYKDFITVIAFMRETVYRQKFSGASSGTFNANLIAYDLGLRSDVAQSQTAGVTININDKKDSSVLEDVKKQLNALDE